MRSLSLVALLIFLSVAPAAESFTLKDGDRVVLLGNTLFEREQRSGWWELALTTRFPGKSVTFRNLGWSGDTVFGEARVGFAYTRTGTASVSGGFQHLKEHTLSLKPTVILLAYGTNESFAGPAGLPRFTKGLETLLDTLAPARARIVLFSPLRQGTMPPPLPAPTEANTNLRLYGDAIRDVAKKRGHLFIDLYDHLGDVGAVRPSITENGIHLTDTGYRWSAPRLVRALGLPDDPALTLDGSKSKQTITADHLAVLPRRVVITGLPAGRHTLFVDGKTVASANAQQWARGVVLERGPEVNQREEVRRLIVAKNELYFHRWRPQNETYLFGFRKHEQGKNAIEIPKFDPLVRTKEKEISVLAAPRPHTYEVKPASK